jgi:hypothetical protein
MSTHHSGALNRVAFVVTFLVAWFALDRPRTVSSSSS